MKTSLLLLISLLSITVLAQKDERPTSPPEPQLEKPNFEQLDRNQDGSIDIEEAKADKDLAKAFPTIAPEGKLEQQTYVEWHIEQAKHKNH